MNSIKKGIMLSLTGFSLFACGDVLFKYLGSYYDIYVVAFFASFFALITLLVTAICTEGLKQAFQTKHRKLHLLRGGILLIQFLCVIYALKNLPIANMYALSFIAPFLTALLAIPLLKEKASWQKWLAMTAGFAGVLIILRPGAIPIEIASIVTLAGALLFSISSIIARLIGKNERSPLVFGLYVELVIVPGTAILALMSGFIMPTIPHLGLLVIAGLFSASGIVFVSRGFTLAPAAIAAPLQYVQMLWAVGFGYLIFGDTLDIWIGTGAAIIIASGIWIVRGRIDQ